jgi:hypothetical protein
LRVPGSVIIYMICRYLGSERRGEKITKGDAWPCVARPVTPKMCAELLKLRTRVTIEAKVSCDK